MTLAEKWLAALRLTDRPVTADNLEAAIRCIGDWLGEHRPQRRLLGRRDPGPFPGLAPAHRRGAHRADSEATGLDLQQPTGPGVGQFFRDNDPVEQGKAIKFNALLTNTVIFHCSLDTGEIVRQPLGESWEVAPEDLVRISPYLTEYINRFGEYSTHELGIQPYAYESRLGVDFPPSRDQGHPLADLCQAA